MDAKQPKSAVTGHVGMVLRRRREELGLSQEGLADIAGVDRTFVGRIERARQSPTLDTLVRLAVALGTTASEVMKEAERMVEMGHQPSAGRCSGDGRQ